MWWSACGKGSEGVYLNLVWSSGHRTQRSLVDEPLKRERLRYLPYLLWIAVVDKVLKQTEVGIMYGIHVECKKSLTPSAGIRANGQTLAPPTPMPSYAAKLYCMFAIKPR